MVWVQAPHRPKKKVQKQRIKPAPPTYRLGLKELHQQPQPQDPSPHCAPRRVVPWPRPSVHRRLVERSPTPKLVTASDKPTQVPEITSEFMETDVEVVEELSQPPPMMPKPTPTRPGDITSTTDPGSFWRTCAVEQRTWGGSKRSYGAPSTNEICWNLLGSPRDRTIGILNCQLPPVWTCSM